MPTVLRFRGFRVVVYPNDHRPAHVHVIGRGCEATFDLNCTAGAVALRENFGFAERELRQILEVLLEKVGELCEAWREIHGI
jgi:hypothetical protein